MPAPENHLLTLPQPDDWHLHIRDGAVMRRVLADTARQFARAIIMPNLKPPVTTVAMAEEYAGRIEKALHGMQRGQEDEPSLELAPWPSQEDEAGSKKKKLTPLLTLYLTDETSPDELRKAAASDVVHGVKLYPAGATTNSASGVTDIMKAMPLFEVMQEVDLPLLVHAEVTDDTVDIFDREAVFIERYLAKIVERFPNLRIVMEHITTKDGIQFVLEARDGVAGTLTAHHLLYNRNHLLAGGIRPHYYCLPVLKAEQHRQALIEAAVSGSPRLFCGTDSAPHLQHTKENACGCAGCYTANCAVELYAEAFDLQADLSLPATQAAFRAFMSENGPKFYQLPVNKHEVTLTKIPSTHPAMVETADGPIVPLRTKTAWQVAS